MSTATMDKAQAKDALKALEREKGELREARNEARKAVEQARREYAESGLQVGTPQYLRAKEAVAALQAADQALDDADDAHKTVLGLFEQPGDGRRSGDYAPAGNGWATAARDLSISDGRLRVDMPAHDLLAAGGFITPSEGLSAPTPAIGTFVRKAQDHRGLYGVFPIESLGEGDAAIVEFRQTGSRTLTGEIERDPVAVTEKANLGLQVELANPSLVQWAAVLDGVPSKLFDFAGPALQGFLESELQYQVELGVDQHALNQIMAADLPGLGSSLLPTRREHGEVAAWFAPC